MTAAFPASQFNRMLALQSSNSPRPVNSRTLRSASRRSRACGRLVSIWSLRAEPAIIIPPKLLGPSLTPTPLASAPRSIHRSRILTR